MKSLTELEQNIIESVLEKAHQSKDFKSVEFMRLLNTYGRDLIFDRYSEYKKKITGFDVYCRYCEDLGIVVAVDKITKIEYFFGCAECRKAEFKKYVKLPKFNARMREYYYLGSELDPYKQPL